jgi:chemotaxis protein CheY-P-specific phosphatase CheC
MSNIARKLSAEELGQKIDQTLINLRVSFTPEEWTQEERLTIKEDIEKIEDLANSILEKLNRNKG